MAMWGMFFGGGDDDDSPNPIVLLLVMILAPLAAGILQMAVSRSREYEADRTGARLIGDGEPLARALLKLEQAAKQIPMNVAARPGLAVHREPPHRAQGATSPSLFTTPPADRGPGRAAAGRDWQN